MKSILLAIAITVTFEVTAQSDFEYVFNSSKSKTGYTDNAVFNSIDSTASYVLLEGSQTGRLLKIAKDYQHVLLEADYSVNEASANTIEFSIPDLVGNAFYNLSYQWQTKKSEAGYYLRKIDLSTKQVTYNLLISSDPSKQDFGVFEMNHNYCWIKGDDKKKAIIIDIYDKEKKVNSKTFDLSKKGVLPASINDYFYNVSLMEENRTPTLKESSRYTKMYYEGNKIILYVTCSWELPARFTFDMDNGSFKKEEIALKGFTGVEANKYYTDAFQLYKGKIYLLHVSKGKMEIGIFEKSDLKLIKKLEIGEDQLGKLAFQPYHSISRKFAHKASVPTINQIAKILGNNPFGITVEETATGSILLTGGIDNSSAITVSKTDPSRIAYESLRANFKVLLKPDNLDILPGSDKPPIEKIIYDYRRQAGVRIPEFEYFVSQGSLYHAFCKGEKFIIRKLNLDGSSSLSKN